MLPQTRLLPQLTAAQIPHWSFIFWLSLGPLRMGASVPRQCGRRMGRENTGPGVLALGEGGSVG